MCDPRLTAGVPPRTVLSRLAGPALFLLGGVQFVKTPWRNRKCPKSGLKEVGGLVATLVDRTHVVGMGVRAGRLGGDSTAAPDAPRRDELAPCQGRAGT
jgi:hypothetical protein